MNLHKVKDYKFLLSTEMILFATYTRITCLVPHIHDIKYSKDVINGNADWCSLSAARVTLFVMQTCKQIIIRSLKRLVIAPKSRQPAAGIEPRGGARVSRCRLAVNVRTEMEYKLIFFSFLKPSVLRSDWAIVSSAR